MTDRRPQLVPEPGKRVVLVIPREVPTDPSVPADRKLMTTLEEIQEGGWTLVAVVEPSHHLDALAMVVDGLADVVVVTRPEDFPVIRLASQLNGTGRTQPVARPGMSRTRSVGRGQRPRLVGLNELPGDRRPA